MWTKATDYSLIVTLLVAIPATWIADHVIIHEVESFEISGRLSSPDGKVYSAVLDVTVGESTPLLESRPAGNFQLRAIEERHGWPLTTSVHVHPAVIDIDILSEPRARKNAQLAPDSPIRIAVEETLSHHGHSDELSAWHRTNTVRHMHWPSVFVAAAAWWVVLMFLATAAIQSLHFGTFMFNRRRLIKEATLRSKGRCAKCGYDMTGLEFNERCPECGELVW